MGGTDTSSIGVEPNAGPPVETIEPPSVLTISVAYGGIDKKREALEKASSGLVTSKM
jgi:hypothetical protein